MRSERRRHPAQSIRAPGCGPYIACVSGTDTSSPPIGSRLRRRVAFPLQRLWLTWLSKASIPMLNTTDKPPVRRRQPPPDRDRDDDRDDERDDNEAPETPPTEPDPVPVEEPPNAPGKRGPYVVG